MAPEELRGLYLSGELHAEDEDDIADDPDYELDEDDMNGDIFEEDDDFHGKNSLP